MIDFPKLAEALLARVRELLPLWYPAGKFSGREYTIGNLAGDPGASLSINIENGRWQDFATGQKGGDLISLFAARGNLSQADAARQLLALIGRDLPPVLPSKSSSTVRKPPPMVATPDFVIPELGAPAHIHEYRDSDGALLHYVARYEPARAPKQFRPWSWNGTRWVCKNWFAPRPLYRLPELSRRPADPVIIVEGEKSAEAAAVLVPDSVAITWNGGASAVNLADWSPLENRHVLIWPDSDQPGIKASEIIRGKLSGLAASCTILDVSDMPDGWDAADALADGWTPARFLEWAAPRRKSASPVILDLGRSNAHTPAKSRAMLYAELGLVVDANGVPYTNADNAVRILEHDPKFTLWHDTFLAENILNGKPITDSDIIEILIYIQKELKIVRFSEPSVRQGVIAVAAKTRKNSVQEWLTSLAWDDTPRIDKFFVDSCDAEDNTYVNSVSRNFWISLVARIMNPGCKVDNMIVLEGPQGWRKSSLLATIGAQYYTEASEDIQSKDFFLCLRGKFLVEISELDAFSRADASRIKQVISCASDRYREPYAHYAADYPRQCIFAGTTNDHSYLRDPTGGRRFWPIAINNEINTSYVSEYRDQFFAEAFAAWKSGQSWWHVPPEAIAEQQDRFLTDAWHDHVELYMRDRDRATTSQILSEALHIEPGRQSRQDNARVNSILRYLGFRWSREGDRMRRWIR